jgi:hypothetical protein
VVEEEEEEEVEEEGGAGGEEKEKKSEDEEQQEVGQEEREAEVVVVVEGGDIWSQIGEIRREEGTNQHIHTDQSNCSSSNMYYVQSKKKKGVRPHDQISNTKHYFFLYFFFFQLSFVSLSSASESLTKHFHFQTNLPFYLLLLRSCCGGGRAWRDSSTICNLSGPLCSMKLSSCVFSAL